MKLFGFSITACSCDNFDRSVEFGVKKTDVLFVKPLLTSLGCHLSSGRLILNYHIISNGNLINCFYYRIL